MNIVITGCAIIASRVLASTQLSRGELERDAMPNALSLAVVLRSVGDE